MCQCQLSSVELATGEAMPPCAATVCERVGNALESTATLRLAPAMSSAARMPAPPAPTTIASNLRTGKVTSSPEDLHRPAQVAGEDHEGSHFEGQPQTGRLHVIHVDVAHSHPGVPGEADRKEERGDAHPALLEQAGPDAIAQRCVRKESYEYDHR